METSTSFVFKNLSVTAEAISRLLHPYAEAVVHNLRTNKIVFIFNSFSKRKVGDPSLLEEEAAFIKETNVLGPYEKVNWDGRPLKSISSIIRDNKGRPLALLCINLDISVLEECQMLIQAFMHKAPQTSQPRILFKDDWQERINQFIHTYLHEKNWHFKTLNSAQKKSIVENLRKNGAFSGKNSAQYIAKILKISRATVYNYLDS